MKFKTLAPIKESTGDFEDIEQAIIKLLKDELYLPLLKELQIPKKILNSSTNDLIELIRKNKVYYDRGSFRGKFNSSASQYLKSIGAKWDNKTKAWQLPETKIPIQVKTELMVSQNKMEQQLQLIDQKLSKVLPEEIADKLEISKQFQTVLWKVNKKVSDQVKNITVIPKLSTEEVKKITYEYQLNLRRYISDFTQKEIIELRQKVQESAFKGVRSENLVKMIQKSYGVSERKAKFLARQETALLMTKFKETRYTEAGVKKYIWGCVAQRTGPHAVRPDHLRLEGKVFSWDNPPITDRETGARNNPGEDFNCRCFARPIVEF
jgi:SPP1 gp7 family putative phage head morphogenesis protein